MGISQFLISYWWLIVLAIIIIAVITRSLLKIAITLVVLIVVFVLFWEVFISSGFTKSTQCFTHGAKLADVTFQKAQTMSPGNERNQFICSEDLASIKRLTDCLNITRKENKLSFVIYSSLPTMEQTINETITSHNKACPDSPLEKPVFKD